MAMKLGNAVKGARPVGDYRIRVVFRDGYIGEVDLWPIFEKPLGPMTEPFRDPEFFQRVAVDTEMGVVTWPNGYDICSDVLRYYCELGRVATRLELDAYFDLETSLAVLNDKPTT